MNQTSPAVYQPSWRIVLIGLVVASVVAALSGWANPVMAETDWRYYHQFRHSSALPANLFGISPEGRSTSPESCSRTYRWPIPRAMATG